MVTSVGKIKPDGWLKVDLPKAGPKVDNTKPSIDNWETVVKITAFLASEALAFGYQFVDKPLIDIATLQFDPATLCLRDFLPFAVAGGANYLGPKAAKKVQDFWKQNNPKTVLLGTPPDNLIHMHNCLEQMQHSDFDKYGKARAFLKALSQDPKHFEIEGWNDEEKKELKGLVELIPTDGSLPDQTKCGEATKKTYDLIHTRYRNKLGYIPSLENATPQIALDALNTPFQKLFGLINNSDTGDDHFLKPLLVNLLQKTVKIIKENGKNYIVDKDEKKAFEDMCDDFDEAVKDKPIDEAVKELFGQRIALIFGYKIPFTSPALKDPDLGKPKRKKEIILEKVPTVSELKVETAKIQEECVEKGSLFAWHWLLIHVIGGSEDVEITPCIQQAFASPDPMTTFNEAITAQLNSNKIPAWRRITAKFLWHFTPLYGLTKFMMRRSIHATEKWFNEQLEAKQANQFDISEAKAVESTLKTWVKANSKVTDTGSYEDEVSEILANGRARKIRINQLTNVLVDTCFPAINLIGWCECWDKTIANSHLHAPYFFRPFVWLGSYPVRGALSLLKFGLLGAQRALNFIGRFFTKMLLKRLGVVHKLFDFRSRLQKGDHFNIETKLKSFFLSMITELNATDFNTDPTYEELKRFNRVNHNVEQCAYALLRVLDMHETSNWSKEGIAKALKGNFVEKEIRERALPTVIEKGVVLFNEIYHEFILKPEKYELVRRNLFRAFSESMTDTSPPPPEIDEDIKTEIHEFRTKVIRHIVLRTLSELGEDERTKACYYVKELQNQKPVFTELEKELKRLKNAVGSQPVYNTSKITSETKKGLTTSDSIFKKYQLPLRSVYPKVSEIYNGFLIPLQDIKDRQSTLDGHLENVSEHLKIKDRFTNLRDTSWGSLKLHLGLGKKNPTFEEKAKSFDSRQVTEFIECVGKLDYQTDQTTLTQARKRLTAFVNMQLCNQAIADIESLKTLNRWQQARKRTAVQHVLHKLKITQDPDSCLDALKQKKEALEKIMQTLAFSNSPDDFGKQLGALKILALEQGHKLNTSNPYMDRHKQIKLLLDTLLNEMGNTTPLERCFDKHNDSNETTESSSLPDVRDALQKLAILSPSRFLQNDLSCWLDNKEAFARIQLSLKEELEDLGLADSQYQASHTISARAIQHLLDDCVTHCENNFDHWKDAATSQIDLMLESTQKLIDQSNDKTLSIPYFNFVYSATQGNDPVPIQMLNWFIGENVERTTQKVLDLAKHPVFLPWALREAVLAAVAPVA